jgi:hypothetical protein
MARAPVACAFKKPGRRHHPEPLPLPLIFGPECGKRSARWPYYWHEVQVNYFPLGPVDTHAAGGY